MFRHAGSSTGLHAPHACHMPFVFCEHAVLVFFLQLYVQALFKHVQTSVGGKTQEQPVSGAARTLEFG